MNSGERSTLDRESVKELLEGSQFDDSVHVEHQSDLRAERTARLTMRSTTPRSSVPHLQKIGM